MPVESTRIWILSISPVSPAREWQIGFRGLNSTIKRSSAPKHGREMAIARNIVNIAVAAAEREGGRKITAISVSNTGVKI